MNMGEYGHDRGGETEGEPTYEELVDEVLRLREANTALRREIAVLRGDYDRVDDSSGAYVTNRIPVALKKDGTIEYS